MIDLFSAANAGIGLNPTQIQSAQLTVGSLSGFFLRTDLLKLLAPPESVGIRIYDYEEFVPVAGSNDSIPRFRLAACAITADGMEINSGDDYYFAHPANGFVRNSITPIDHAQAAIRVNAGNIRHGFMSFFSKEDLMDNLFDGDPEGLSFYNAQLNILQPGDFNVNLHESDFINNRSNFQSHIAFKTDLVGGFIPLMPNTTGNILSLYPCPGHCVVKQTSGNEINVDPEELANATQTDPYLFEWRDS